MRAAFLNFPGKHMAALRRLMEMTRVCLLEMTQAISIRSAERHLTSIIRAFCVHEMTLRNPFADLVFL